MEGSFRVGRVAGVEVRVHFTWLLAFGLVTWSLAQGVFPSTYPRWSPTTYWTVGAVAALLLFVCVLLHELSHALVARARGMPVDGITLFIFGGVTSIHGDAREPGDEFWMAFVGPLTSFALAVLAWALLRTIGGGRTPLAAVLSYLAYVNLALGVFNLIPGFPLDGGRVLRSALWALTRDLRQATRIAARVGQGVSALFVLGGVVMAFQSEIVNGIWLGFIGWFLFNAAATSYRQAAAPPAAPRSVGAAMQPPVIVSDDLSVAELVARYLLPYPTRAVLVGEAGRVVGSASVVDVQSVPPEQWASTPLRAVMTPAARLAVIDPESSLEEALLRLDAQNLSHLVVVRHGALVGLLHRADVLQALRRAPNAAADDEGGASLGSRP